MQAISSMLTHHSLLHPVMGIRRINLSSNPIGNYVVELMPGLETSESLLQLDLASCQLDDVAAGHLLTAMRRNFTLIALDLEDNAIDQQVTDAISAEIIGDALLQQITCSPCDIDASTLEPQVPCIDTR